MDGISIINNEVQLLSEAKIPVTDRGFLFGHSVFETVLVSNGKLIAWDNHCERLKHSCKRTFINAPDFLNLKKQAIKAVEENIKITNFTAAKMSLRIIVTGGCSVNLPIHNYFQPPNIIIICRNISGPSLIQYEDGISLQSQLDLRPKGLVDIKSCNYLFSIMSLEYANQDNYDDVLFYDLNNYFTECTTANFIWFDKKYNIYSAPFKDNCLPGTTLTLLIEALRCCTIKFQWKALKKNQIDKIYGCAILSSTRLILPVKKIDEYELDVKKHYDFFNKLNDKVKQIIENKE